MPYSALMLSDDRARKTPSYRPVQLIGLDLALYQTVDESITDSDALEIQVSLLRIFVRGQDSIGHGRYVFAYLVSSVSTARQVPTDRLPAYDSPAMYRSNPAYSGCLLKKPTSPRYSWKQFKRHLTETGSWERT